MDVQTLFQQIAGHIEQAGDKKGIAHVCRCMQNEFGKKACEGFSTKEKNSKVGPAAFKKWAIQALKTLYESGTCEVTRLISVLQTLQGQAHVDDTHAHSGEDIELSDTDIDALDPGQDFTDDMPDANGLHDMDTERAAHLADDTEKYTAEEIERLVNKLSELQCTVHGVSQERDLAVGRSTLAKQEVDNLTVSLHEAMAEITRLNEAGHATFLELERYKDQLDACKKRLDALLSGEKYLEIEVYIEEMQRELALAYEYIDRFNSMAEENAKLRAELSARTPTPETVKLSYAEQAEYKEKIRAGLAGPDRRNKLLGFKVRPGP